MSALFPCIEISPSLFLRESLYLFWVFVRSDGAQPHLVNIQFQKKVQLQLVVLYVDFKLDESYTPSKISIRAGDGFHNLKVTPSGYSAIYRFENVQGLLRWLVIAHMYL